MKLKNKMIVLMIIPLSIFMISLATAYFNDNTQVTLNQSFDDWFIYENGFDYALIGDYIDEENPELGVWEENTILGFNEYGVKYKERYRNLIIPHVLFGNEMTRISGQWIITESEFIYDNLIIEEGYKHIEKEAFSSYKMGNNKGPRIENIELPTSLQTISRGAFAGTVRQDVLDLSHLTNLEEDFGDMSTTGSRGIFEYGWMSTFILPEQITKIPDKLLIRNNLENIEIPKTITEIGKSAFYANRIESLTFKHSNSDKLVIGQAAFHDNLIKTLSITNNISLEEANSFAYNKLEKVEFVNPLSYVPTKIGSGVFHDNSNLTYLGVPNSIRSFGQVRDGDGLFKTSSPIANTNITNLTFGKNIEEINLEGAASLTNVKVDRFQHEVEVFLPEHMTIDDIQWKSIFKTNGNNTITGFVDGFDSSTLTGELVIPSSVNGVDITHIDYSSFAFFDPNHNYKLVSKIPNVKLLVISDGITEIGSVAFGGGNFDSVSLPNTLTTISGQAFVDGALKSLTIPDSVTYMGQATLRNNPLETLHLGTGLTVLEVDNIRGTNLKEVIIPKNITKFNKQGIYANPIIGNNPLLEKIIIEGRIENLPNYSISSNPSLTELQLPNSLKTVSEKAFGSSSKLKHLNLPSSITRFDAEHDFYLTLNSIHIDKLQDWTIFPNIVGIYGDLKHKVTWK